MDLIEIFTSIIESHIPIEEQSKQLVDAFKSLKRYDFDAKNRALDIMSTWLDALNENDKIKAFMKVKYCFAYNSYTNSEYEALFKLHHDLKRLDKSPEDQLYYALICRLVAYSAFIIGMVNLSIENAYLALSMFLQLQNQPEVVRSYMALGVCYSVVPDYDLQIHYFNKALELAEKLGDVTIQKSLHNNIAYASFQVDKISLTKEHVYKGLNLLDEGEVSLVALGLKVNETRLIAYEGNYEEALSHIKSIRLMEVLKSDSSIKLDLFQIEADCYKALKRLDLYESTLLKALSASEELKAPKYSIQFATHLSAFFELRGDFEQAFFYEKTIRLASETLEAEKANFHYLVLRIQNEVDMLNHERMALSEALDITKKELKGTQEVTIYALATLAEFRDQVTGNHILRTSHYVKAFCRHLVQEHLFEDILTPSFISDFSRSASLHDIGKVGVSDVILNKPSTLTEAEFELIKKHTAYGRDALAITERILGEDSFLKMAQVIAYTHHEKWNGTGYPEGLRGEDIPLVGRIMAIIDVYDALISKRAYKKPFPHLKAIKIIQEGMGSHFDPILVEVFLSHHMDFYDIAKKLLDAEEEHQTLSLGLN